MQAREKATEGVAEDRPGQWKGQRTDRRGRACPWARASVDRLQDRCRKELCPSRGCQELSRGRWAFIQSV